MEIDSIIKITVLIFVGMVFLLYIIFSLILLYHWKKYEHESETISSVKKIYFSVTSVLIIVAVVSALTFFIVS